MLPLTIKTPKPLLKINNKSIISYQIERLLELNFKQILVNGHYLFNELNKQLKIYSPYVKVIYEEEILETGGGLLNLLKKKIYELRISQAFNKRRYFLAKKKKLSS